MKTKPEFRKVVFEYDCMCFFGGSYKLILLENGRLIREDYNLSMPIVKESSADEFEVQIINSPELAKAIKQLIKKKRGIKELIVKAYYESWHL